MDKGHSFEHNQKNQNNMGYDLELRFDAIDKTMKDMEKERKFLDKAFGKTKFHEER